MNAMNKFSIYLLLLFAPRMHLAGKSFMWFVVMHLGARVEFYLCEKKPHHMKKSLLTHPNTILSTFLSCCNEVLGYL